MFNKKLNAKIFAIFSIAIMLLSLPFAMPTNAASSAQSSVIMGAMPTNWFRRYWSLALWSNT